MKGATHSMFFAIVASAMLLPALASQHEPIERRAVNAISIPDVSSLSSPQSSTAAAATSTQAPATTAAASSSPASTSSAGGATSAAPASSASNAPTTSAAASSTHAGVATSVVPTTATDSLGQVVTSFVVNTVTPSSATPSQTGTSDDSSLGTGSIIGLSVAGGLTALGIVLFLVWKCTRKRFTDFDDNEAIKWPELNSHNNDVHALPTNSTGRAGFGPENDSDVDLMRVPSPGGGYSNSIAASSVPETYGTGDPYAVPPLPHLNPNQPYYDDPGAYNQSAAYYDPYRGPVPNTFTDTVSDGHDTESIPMTQMARTRSPAPQVAYDMQGRGSPAPQAAMSYAGMDDRSRTPVPGTLSAGRASPSPHAEYGYNPQ